MRVGLKKQGVFGVKRILLSGKIDKIERKEIPPGGEKGLSIFFKGSEGSGVISLDLKEIAMLEEKVKPSIFSGSHLDTLPKKTKKRGIIKRKSGKKAKK